MKYFKNTELANIYKISEKSVRNWIQAAQEGKLDLQLFDKNGRFYVANTLKNTTLIEQLVKKGQKYKNSRGAKTVTPSKEFYKVYSQKQILDIISSIIIHHEIPLQYSYLDGGADSWDQYANRLTHEPTANILTRTVELMDVTANNVDTFLEGHNRVNVVDLGPGNGLPIRSTLARLLEQGRLGRYIAIDISQDMLSIVEKNIQQWFDGKITYESYVRDVTYERFNDLLAEDYIGGEAPANLVCFLGGTLSNFRSSEEVLHAINNSLGPQDILVYSGYLDTPKTRRYFDFHSTGKLPSQSRLILDFLNVDESYYDVEQLFSEERRARTISVRLKVDLSIQFELENGTRTLELRKNDSILLWRHRHYSTLQFIELFEHNNFILLQATKSPEREYILLTTKIRTHN